MSNGVAELRPPQHAEGADSDTDRDAGRRVRGRMVVVGAVALATLVAGVGVLAFGGTPRTSIEFGSPDAGSATGEAPVAVEEGIDLEPPPGEGHPCAKSNKAQRAALAPVASPEGGMAVRASPLTVSPGEPVYVVVTNTTAGSYGTGLYCRVEQWRDDGWEAAHYVRPDTGEYAYPSQLEHMVLLILDPGQSMGLRVDTTFLQPGRYRTTHEFDGRGSTRGTTVVVDFEVVDERN